MNIYIFETEQGFINIYAFTPDEAWELFQCCYSGIDANIIGFLPFDLVFEEWC